MENRKAIRARVLLKRARARLSGDTLGLLEAVLRDAHPTDARWVIESIDRADGMLRALVTVALFYADVPAIAFRSAFRIAWTQNHRQVAKVARAEGECLLAMFRHASFPIPDKIPPVITVYRGARGVNAGAAGQGLSWTSSYGAACMYGATPNMSASIVLSRRIRRENILWYSEDEAHDEIVHAEGAGGALCGDAAEWSEMVAHWTAREETRAHRAEARLPVDGFEPLSAQTTPAFMIERAQRAVADGHRDADYLTRNLETRLFANDKYTVGVDDYEDPNYAHIYVIRNLTSDPIPWDDLQAIKAQLFGDEAEAVELYPAASRTVNDADLRHLWVNKGSGFSIGWGWR